MSPRRRSEAVVAAAMFAAAAVSFLTAYRGWEGSTDAWNILFLSLGGIFIIMGFAALALMMRTYAVEEDLRVPMVVMTRGEFTREPPIGGKGPQ